MSMDQDLPWRDTFELKDLKLLFSREIEEGQDPYVKEDLSFGDRSMNVENMTIDEIKADFEDIEIYLEDPTMSVNLKSEKQQIMLKNLESNDLKLLLDKASIGKSVTTKLIGCNFGIKMFPPSAGLSCVDEAFITLNDVVLTFIFEEEAKEDLDKVGGDLILESIDVLGKNSSLLDLDVNEGDVDMGDLGKSWEEVSLEGRDFDFDLSEMVLDFGRLELNSDGEVGQGLSFDNYSREFKDLIGNLKDLVHRGLKFVKK